MAYTEADTRAKLIDPRLKSSDWLESHIEPKIQWFAKYPKLKPSSILADTGYFSETNINSCEVQKITPFPKEKYSGNHLWYYQTHYEV